MKYIFLLFCHHIYNLTANIAETFNLLCGATRIYFKIDDRSRLGLTAAITYCHVEKGRIIWIKLHAVYVLTKVEGRENSACHETNAEEFGSVCMQSKQNG